MVVIFHQNFFFFLIEKNGFDLLEKELCGELLLWFNFSFFLLFENQNNFTFISGKKKNTNVGKMRIGRNSDLCAAGLQKPKNLHF